MGAWGLGTFDNDDASDWFANLEESNDLSLVESAFEFEEDYIEAPEACNALAAAEIVLALLGKPRENLPEEAGNWVNKNSSLNAAPLKSKAINYLAKILSENSELKELWAESDEYQAWENDVNSIKVQLENS